MPKSLGTIHGALDRLRVLLSRKAASKRPAIGITAPPFGAVKSSLMVALNHLPRNACVYSRGDSRPADTEDCCCWSYTDPWRHPHRLLAQLIRVKEWLDWQRCSPRWNLSSDPYPQADRLPALLSALYVGKPRPRWPLGDVPMPTERGAASRVAGSQPEAILSERFCYERIPQKLMEK